MAIKVDPYIEDSTHDVELTDGKRIIGLMIINQKGDRDPLLIRRAPIESNAFKMTSGSQEYSDMEFPWTPTAQQSWIAGRAVNEFDKVPNKYYDSKRANTMEGRIIHGPQEQIVSGNRDMSYSLQGDMNWTSLILDKKYMAIKFVPTSYSAANIYLHLKRVGNPGTLNVSIYDDNLGNPFTQLKSDTVSTTEIKDILSEFWRFTFAAEAMTGGNDYWIVVETDLTDGPDNHWKLGVKKGVGTTKKSTDGSTWETANVDIYYLITDADVKYRPLFFQYKRALYLLENPESGAPKLLINGDRGVADTNAGDLYKLKDGSKAWTTNALSGASVLIIGGKGSAETKPYRRIASNQAQEATMETPWLIEHDTTTEYVIIGSSFMQPIDAGTHGLTAPVTDVLVINNICYFCQGDDVAIRRYIWDQNAGAERHRWDADGTNKATYLKQLLDKTDGLVIMSAMNSPDKKIYQSGVKDWGTNLTFSEKYHFKDDHGKITYIFAYGSPQYLWVFREGTVFQYSSGVVEEIPLTEIRAFMSDKNGYGALPHNVYLYFPLRYGLERYYNANLDDLGPDRDEGLPPDRQGFITKLIGYPGIIFAMIDGEEDNYSTLLGYNMEGWFELYRAPMPGMRMEDAIFQVVQGNDLDRLYIYVGGLVMWLPFPKKSKRPTSDPNYMYNHEAMVESGWIYTNMMDLNKFYNSVKVWAENLSGDEQYIEIDYKIDDDEDWKTINDRLNITPVDEIFIGELMAEGGKRIKIRVRSQTNNCLISPEIKTLLVDTVSRITIRYSYGFRYRLLDSDINIQGELSDEQKADVIQDTLDYWAENLIPLKMNARRLLFHDKRVFIDAIPVIPNKDNKEGYVGEIIINQVKQNIRKTPISVQAE